MTKRFVKIGNKQHALHALPEVDATILRDLVAKRDYKGGGEEEIASFVANITSEMTIYPTPDFLIYHTPRTHDKDSDELKSVAFTLKGAASYRAFLPEKFEFEVPVDDDFYRNVVENFITYFQIYEQQSTAKQNAQTLTAKVAHVADKNKIKLPQAITFVLGEGVPYITNSEIHIGLTSDVLVNLVSSPLFEEASGEDLLSSNAESIIISYLSSIDSYEKYFHNGKFTELLGLSKRSIGGAIRENISRRLSVGRNSNLFGTFYALCPIEYEQDEKKEELLTISLVERVAMTPEDIERLQNDETYKPYFESGAYVVEDNTKPKKPLSSKGMTKILSYLTLSPVPYNILQRGADKKAIAEACSKLTLKDVMELEKNTYKR